MCIFLHNTAMLLVNICSEIATVFLESFVFKKHFKGKYRGEKKKKSLLVVFFLFFFSCNFLLIETCDEESLSEFIHTCFTPRPYESISTRTGVVRQASPSMLTRGLTLSCKSEKTQFKHEILSGCEHSTGYSFPHPILLIQ